MGYMRWIEFSVEAHAEAVDAVSSVFTECGTGGVAIEQAMESHIEGEEPPTFHGLPMIKAYLPLDSAAPEIERRIEAALWHLQAFNLSPLGPLRRREVEEEDWANGWKEHFHPLKIGRVVIKPTWREWNAFPGEMVVELDPGMAFGTGLHPTTHLMIEAMQERVRSNMQVFDAGTGSGILAVVAAKMGATVTAVDISEVAVEVAQGNIQANGVSEQVTVTTASIEAAEDGRYDVILANIIARVLVDIASELHRALKPGAEVLASGIIDERVEMVRQEFERVGMELTSQKRDGDWWLVIARRPV
ncbi:MAG: 50S ribosomal protein L11 methyltransferase [Chloroflexota bacterium]